MSLAAFIAAQRARYGVPHVVACRALGVSQAWLYKWLHADVSLRRKRRAAVDAAVAYEFARRQGRDGSPPITTRLRDAGWRISKNTVADSMRRQGLVARPRKRRRGLTKAERRAHKPADLLGRDFCPPVRINQRWVSDLTQIDTDEGALYLASILDLRSRRAVGYAMGAHHDADLAAAAVQVAIATRGGDVAGVVLHTDQGGEFSGGALARVCAAAGIIQSMGRTGSALDNAVAESFHSTLEFELRAWRRFSSREQARRDVAAWLAEYNTDRLHSTNGMISPVDYENGRRRAGAKTYDQLRRHHQRTDQNSTANNPSEAASPPLSLPAHSPRRGGGRAAPAYGPAPPASRVADAIASPRPCGPPTDLRAALDPGASAGPGAGVGGRRGPAPAGGAARLRSGATKIKEP